MHITALTNSSKEKQQFSKATNWVTSHGRGPLHSKSGNKKHAPDVNQQYTNHLIQFPIFGETNDMICLAVDM